MVEYSKYGGVNWKQTHIKYKNFTNISDAGSAYISFANDEIGYLLYCSTPGAGMMTKILFSSKDAGESFQLVENLTEKVSGYPQGISFLDDKTGYIATSYHGENEYLYQTKDQGETWESVEVFPKGENVNYIDAYSPVFATNHVQNGIILLKEVAGETITYRLFETHDAGNTWIEKKAISKENIVNYTLGDEKTIYLLDSFGELYMMN